MVQKGRIFTGARARFSMNGVPVGFARGCTSRESVEHEPFKALGALEVLENVPVGYAVAFSASMATLVGESLKSIGWQPKVGTSTETLLANVLAIGELTVTIEDKKTGDVIEIIEQLRFASRSTSYQTGSIIMQDVEFVGIRSRDAFDV